MNEHEKESKFTLDNAALILFLFLTVTALTQRYFFLSEDELPDDQVETLLMYNHAVGDLMDQLKLRQTIGSTGVFEFAGKIEEMDAFVIRPIDPEEYVLAAETVQPAIDLTVQQLCVDSTVKDAVYFPANKDNIIKSTDPTDDPDNILNVNNLHAIQVRCKKEGSPDPNYSFFSEPES